METKRKMQTGRATFDDITITQTPEEARHMIVFLMSQEADVMKAAGHREEEIVYGILRRIARLYLSKARPVDDDALDRIGGTMRAVLADKFPGWRLVKCVKNPSDCAGIRVQLQKPDGGVIDG